MAWPRPFVWWAKIRDVPSAPDSFELRHNGTMLGRWHEPNGSVSTHILSDVRMRAYGYEKCYCFPLDDLPDPECPAHGGAPGPADSR